MLERDAGGPLAGAQLVAFLGTTRPSVAKQFFAEILGLRLISEDQFAIVFEGGGITLRVTPVAELTPRPFTALGWRVADIAAVVRVLAARGVAVERFPGVDQDALGVWHAPSGAAVAWFKDPDGNLLSVTEQ
jgi:catechol 2,3-dioxygenase-like lactoylglutathione lyase family enzyme